MPSATSLSTQQIPLTCSGHTRPVVQLSFSDVVPGNHFMLISACKDGKPILRDGPTGDWLGTFLGHKGAVWSAMLNADTSRAVTASADYTAKVWSAFTGQELVSLPHNHIVKSADFADGGVTVVTGGQDKCVRVFDVNRPDASTTLATHDAPIRSVKWSKHRHLMVSAGDDRRINLIDLRSNSAAKTIEIEGDNIASVSLTSDGRLLSCAAGKRACVWDLDTFKTVKEMSLEYDVSVAAINPQRSRIVTGGKSDLLIRNYDFESGKELETHKGHHGPVHDACFSPDGEIYATGSEDGTVRLWQTNPGTAYGLWQLRKI
ncbi:WD40 repeat-like protein [Martensiomyces pterosporus]|nr:WD40 repeat-like protein [Martensiomyces pterosporus]